MYATPTNAELKNVFAAAYSFPKAITFVARLVRFATSSTAYGLLESETFSPKHL
jgi:hypothetical protein